MRQIQSLKAAVVGTGFIGRVHIEALRRLGVEVVGVVGSSPERVIASAGSWPLPQPYECFEAMLADDRVDVVHIATPNHLHFDQAQAALAAGKHVVCEKPLGLSSSETSRLLGQARRSGLVHAVNFNMRFYPLCLEARSRVQSGAIGESRLISGAYLQDWLLYDTDWNWRLDPAEGGALRAVADIGSHWLDLISFITGRRIEAVMADLSTFVPTRQRPTRSVDTFADVTDIDDGESVSYELQSDDVASLLLRFDGGARGVVTLSQVSPGRRNRLTFEIAGATSSLAWNSESPEDLWVGHRGRPNELVLRDPSLLGAAAAAHTTNPAGHPEGFSDTFKELYRSVYTAVATGAGDDADLYPTFEAGHAQALIAEAILRSTEEETWVEVKSLRSDREAATSS